MDKTRLKLLAGLLALSLADPLIAACYEWVDEEGVVHFADQRPPGDRPVVEHRELQATEPNGKGKLSPEDASALDEAQAALLTGDDVKAYNLIRPLAERGIARAENGLGLIYNRGKAVERDVGKAFYWHRRAAEKSYDKAQFNVGLMYADGEGVAKDSAKAVMWLCKAADQGYAQAQVSLGAMYANGEGVKQDYLRAAEWYRKAAEQGLREAQYALGFMYQEGQGLAKDRNQAVHWLELAAAQGEVRALTLLNRMATPGTGDERQSAEAFAKAPPTGRAKFNLVISDDPCLDAGPQSPAAGVAKCYAWLEKVIKVLPVAEKGESVSTPRVTIGPDNVVQVGMLLRQQISDLGATISRRGYPAVAGIYRAKAAPSCGNIQSTWAGMIGKGAAAGIVIVQDGFHIGITQRFDHGGKSGSVTVQGVVVESAIAFYDPVSSDFGFVGEVENRQIMVRPDVEAILNAWPRFAPPPSAADLADCVVVLVGNS
jgi:TPR repeat protein